MKELFSLVDLSKHIKEEIVLSNMDTPENAPEEKPKVSLKQYEASVISSLVAKIKRYMALTNSAVALNGKTILELEIELANQKNIYLNILKKEKRNNSIFKYLDEPEYGYLSI